MKALKYILYGLVIAAAAGLLAYQAFVEKNLDSSNMTRCLLIIAGALIGMLKPRRKVVSNKKVLYQKAYGEFIQDAFHDDPKLEKKFYAAVDDYNRGRFAAGVDKLTKLRRECQRTNDLFAVIAFLGLCCDGMQANADAVKHYTDAAGIRNNSTLHSNCGMCYQRMGMPEEAEEAYHRAIAADEKNAFAWNNLSVLYFREGEYEQALEFAETAIEADATMVQALSCAAVCCGLLDDREGYEKYYRQAVAHGYDGRKIKEVLARMNPDI